MTVKDLIEKLKDMPQDAEVAYFWDSEPRSMVEGVVCVVNDKWLNEGKETVILHDDENDFRRSYLYYHSGIRRLK